MNTNISTRSWTTWAAIARTQASVSLVLLCAAAPALADAAASLDAPDAVPGGSSVPVTWTGPDARFDKIGIAAAGASDQQRPLTSTYLRGKGPAKVTAPEQPGEYEIRYLAHKPAATLARRKLTVLPVTATIAAAATAVGGATVSVTWTGPDNRFDKIGIVAAGAPDKQKPLSSTFLRGKGPAKVIAPEQPGEYEIRYLAGKSGSTLATAKLTVSGASATVAGPGTAVGGAQLSVTWTGPGNRFDKIGIVAAGAPDKQQPLASDFVHGKKPALLRAPEQPGEYEIRYLTGDSDSTLATATLTVTKATASIKGPVTAVAGSTFEVIWEGPGNQHDHIVVAAKGSAEDKWQVTGYVRKGKPLSLRAPLAAGEYELRYLTARSHTTLARAVLQVTAASQEPGTLTVTTSQDTLAGGGAVEVVLDASGSMLQRLGSQRRIDVAIQTLTNLTTKTIPAGTPFALRVLGGEGNSCQTQLELPLRPLDAAAVSAKIASFEPKKNAKTPLAASLEAVAGDLGSVKGERLVILVTDGEETCGGDPARAIEKLKGRGVAVRVNIVGFAIDDAKLAATFGLWASLGGGTYFDARDAAGLDQALALALRPGFDVLDGSNKLVASGFVGGEPIQLMAGKYSVKLKGGAGGSRPVTVRASETSAVQF